jgi:hypothetical protein
MANEAKGKVDPADAAIDALAGAVASAATADTGTEAADMPSVGAGGDSDSAAATTPAPAAPAPAAGGDGLASVPQIVELADQLSACADQLHERIMRDIRAYDGGIVPAHLQASARALLEDELLLRQRANGLYADAASFVVKSLGKSQQGVVALTTAAAAHIRKIALIGDVTGLVAGLLSLAGAAATGQAGAIILALDKIHTHIKDLETHRKPAPASPTKPA